MTNFGVAVGMFGLHNVYGGDARGYLEAARLADQAGVDQLVFTDHVVMGERTDRYPYGDFPLPPSEPLPASSTPARMSSLYSGAPRSFQASTTRCTSSSETNAP